MTELNGCEPKKIKVLGPYTFSIGDTSDFGIYVRGGVATQIKMPIQLKFKSLEEAFLKPEFLCTDFAKFDRPPQLHIAFHAFDLFIEKYGRKPKPWNNEDANLFVELCKTLKGEIELDDKILSKFSKVIFFFFNFS